MLDIGRKTVYRGRMGCARWACAFLRRRSRALPILQNAPQTAQAKKTGSPKGCRLFIAIGAAYGAMRERGRLRLDKLMP
ncbi:hypothetical protein EUC41_04420 [Achromobacter denitrificans]|uniref:hypothetical protein n=1 Tax=Achromobacter denitrificans TaxID=32002 RepID=UPI000F5037DA|nr:hypothetical protein [Achromobacter denitrificans]QCS66119.1 hypothetical protein EC609_29165 [Achromobacter denitrificans]WFC65614.1 hypothetical protein EUC41_04420 [Achromobacter denitrificans]